MIWKTRLLRFVVILRRHAWIVAAFGFFSGVASFLLVDRQEGLARVIAAVMLVSWVWLVLENVLRRWLDTRFHLRLPPPLLRYATQLVHQESLFFVLPFFLITTAWNSGQLVFTSLLIGAALVSVIDPIYYRWLAPRRWLFLGYHTLALFAVLLTALPIILQISTSQSYKLALGASVLLSIPSLAVSITARAWWRGLALVGLTVTMGVTGWYARLWVPPATLRITEVAVAMNLDRDSRAPGEKIDTVDVGQLRAGGLFAYTAINAPLGLKERIFHVWTRDGREVDRIALDIRGGREAGYRSWTHKVNFPEDSAGRWQIKVMTEAGQMVGTLRFRAVAGASRLPSPAESAESAEPAAETPAERADPATPVEPAHNGDEATDEDDKAVGSGTGVAW